MVRALVRPRAVALVLGGALAMGVVGCRTGDRRGTESGDDPLAETSGCWQSADDTKTLTFEEGSSSEPPRYSGSLFADAGTWRRETVDVISLSMGTAKVPETVQAEIADGGLTLRWRDEGECHSVVLEKCPQ